MANETISQKPETKKLAATKAEQVLKAIKDLEAQKAEAIQELLAERLKIDEQLAMLGHTDGKAPKKKAGTPRQKSEICTICKFATDPSHDGRLKFHRDQGENKKPLTDKQLADLGLKKK
jgi:hypothetical protein